MASLLIKWTYFNMFGLYMRFIINNIKILYKINIYNVLRVKCIIFVYKISKKIKSHILIQSTGTHLSYFRFS